MDNLRALRALKLKIASPDEILSWSYGEVIKPETINYRTQRPERDGLFSERIFGPTKDYECYCGKYKKIRHKGITCDKCGVEVTRAIVRRERMGHIALAAPVAHIWFLKTSPSKIGLLLNIPSQKLERVIYYAAYIVTHVDESQKKKTLSDLADEFKTKKKQTTDDSQRRELEEAMLATRAQLNSLSEGRVLSEPEYLDLSYRFAHLFRAGRGAEAIRELLSKVHLEKLAAAIEKNIESARDPNKEKRTLYRLKLARSFIAEKMRPEWMILTVLPVLPPDLRPMVPLDGGRYATSDLNDLYRRVINRNNRLKKLLELKAPEVIIANEKRMLQEAVDSLIDNTARLGSSQMQSSQRRPLKSLADMLKGKQGRFRQNLLGKRVDYSARSVIVVGPNLALDQCGLPKNMALELFKPFVIGKIIARGLAHNIRNATRLIEQYTPEIWKILEEVIADKKVLLNRAPTLHRLGIQAFRPVLIEDIAIRIPPMVCAAFNADFDGDQMAVHVPLTREAQKEAEELMLSSRNLLKPATGDPIVAPSNDIVLGCYYLTRIDPRKDGMDEKEIKAFSSSEEALLAYEFEHIKVNEPIRIKIGKEFVVTSVGRVIFNRVLPLGFKFVNEAHNKKKLQKLFAGIISAYGFDEAWPVLDRIKVLGFLYSSLSGISWGMDDLSAPPEKTELIQAAEEKIRAIDAQYEEGLLTRGEKRARVISSWEETIKKIAEKVPEHLDSAGSVYSIIDSGSRGSWSQPTQMAGMKGLIQDPKGRTIELPIRSSYKEGLGVLEYFINTHGSRKGLIDTALKTASAGYLTRRMVDVAQDVIVSEKDCRTKEGIEIIRADGDAFGYDFSNRVFGRTALEDIKAGKRVLVKANEIIERDAAMLVGDADIKSVKMRSPLTCKSREGVCAMCYGLELGRGALVEIGAAVGVVAAQSIGEPGTQLTLRTFHKGGVAGLDITHGLPRVQELLEAREPKGKAPLAEVRGVVGRIEEKGDNKVIFINPAHTSLTGRQASSKKAKEYLKKAKPISYSVPRLAIMYVKEGGVVDRGEQLCEGSLDLHELFRFKGKEAVQRYIINEVQKIYVSEGTMVNDKHIEIIAGTMFSRVIVKDPGDTDFIIGELVEKRKFLSEQRRVKRRGGLPAKGKLMLTGITKTALSTESFLSAASFQETARILVRAAAEGRTDPLRGLKENVIIGRLIPAGTGFGRSFDNPDDKS